MTPAFVLHKRPYRDTSLLLDVLTQHDGRVNLIAKGAKRPKSPLRAILQSFTPLLIEYSDKGDLRTLKHAEMLRSPPYLHGKGLLSGFYLNELLTQLLPRFAPCEEIFGTYQQTLTHLSHQQHLEMSIRLFEKHLLTHLGYAINFTSDAISHQAIDKDKYYRWQYELGFTESQASDIDIYPGYALLDFDSEHFKHPDTLKHAKKLMRHVISHLLGNNTLSSRELFTSS